jgi:hypothetical protein
MFNIRLYDSASVWDLHENYYLLAETCSHKYVSVIKYDLILYVST